MSEFENSMVRQVKSIPELLANQYGDLEPKTRKVLTTPEISSIQRIVLTGCGDSHAAAMATKYVFETLTGIPTEVVPIIELSRFYSAKQLGFAPNNPLVIAVSNSGNVARIAEGVQRVVKLGGFVLGVTGNTASALGQSASRVLKLNIPPFESAPGVRSYLVSVLTLLLLAIRFGEVRGCYTMDEATAYRRGIQTYAQSLEQALPTIEVKMLELAKRWSVMEAYDFIGAGADYASAFYGHAKVYEAMGKYAMCVNTEEWLHLNFFMRNVEKIATILVCSARSAARSRAEEVLAYATIDMGRPTLLVTSDGAGMHAYGADVVEVPTGSHWFIEMLGQFVPLALLTGYLGAILGEESGRGCKGSWSFARGGAGIQNSRIIVK